MKSTVSVAIENLTTGYRHRSGEMTIGRDINAALRRGELTCLLGPNGAGKSTLLRTLSGFLPALGGEITVNGREMKTYIPRDLAKTIGVVLTERLDVSNMTVRELVGLGRSPYTGFWGRLSAADRRIVDEAIVMMGIEALADRMNQTLSDGERQKMMIAKVIAQQTPIVFLDEPTAFLDFPSKIEIMLLLRRLAMEKNLTVFLSTHDLELALQIADRIWLIDKERGLHTGTPEDLALSGQLAEYFERPGVRFDTESGLFTIDYKSDRAVRVRGNGPRHAILQKALRRNGVAIAADAEPAEVVIDVDESGWTMNGKRYATIDALMDAVNDRFIVAQ